MTVIPASHVTDQSVYGPLAVGPSRAFRGHTTARYSTSRHGLRPSVSLPALPGAGGAPGHRLAAMGIGSQPGMGVDAVMPFHRLPPIGPAAARRPTFDRDYDTYDTLSRVQRLRAKVPPLPAVPAPPIADVRQDPIALYILRKHKR